MFEGALITSVGMLALATVKEWFPSKLVPWESLSVMGPSLLVLFILLSERLDLIFLFVCFDG